MKKHLMLYAQLALAWLALALGVVFLFSPVPLGVAFIALGLSLLVYASESLERKVRAFRGRHAGLNGHLVRFEARLNNRVKFLGDAMQRTRP
ncbi:hypothetical protein [Litorivivens sp.]|uniref:hypothetical protein n=1 Tax=Litorivivens sp. TaxID=2020868 RepID=UPI003568D4F3